MRIIVWLHGGEFAEVAIPHIALSTETARLEARRQIELRLRRPHALLAWTARPLSDCWERLQQH